MLNHAYLEMFKASDHKLEEARLIGMETLEALGDLLHSRSLNLKEGPHTSVTVKEVPTL